MSGKQQSIDPNGYSFYDVIGVSPDDETEVIKKAAEKAEMKAHGDYRDDPLEPEEVTRVRSAGNVLVDEALRNTYDENGVELAVHISDEDGDEILNRDVFVNEKITINPRTTANSVSDACEVIIESDDEVETISVADGETITHRFESIGDKRIVVQRHDTVETGPDGEIPVRYIPTERVLTVEERDVDPLSVELLSHDRNNIPVESEAKFKVTYDGSNASVPRASVYSGSTEVATTNARGEFTYTPNTPSDTTLRIEAENSGRYAQGEVTVKPKKERKRIGIRLSQDLDELYMGDEVTVSVIDDDEDRVTGATVTFEFEDETVQKQASGTNQVQIELIESGDLTIRVEKSATRTTVYRDFSRKGQVNDPVGIDLRTSVVSKSRFSGEKVHISAMFPDVESNYSATGYDDVVSFTIIRLAGDGRKMGVAYTEDVDLDHNIETTFEPTHSGDFRVKADVDGYRTVTDEFHIDEPVASIDDDEGGGDTTNTSNQDADTETDTSGGLLNRLPIGVFTDNRIVGTILGLYRNPTPKSNIGKALVGSWAMGVIVPAGLYDVPIEMSLLSGVAFISLIMFPAIATWAYIISPLVIIGNGGTLQGIEVYKYIAGIPLAIFLYYRKPNIV